MSTGDLKNLLCVNTPYVRRAAMYLSTFTERTVMLRNVSCMWVQFGNGLTNTGQSAAQVFAN